MAGLRQSSCINSCHGIALLSSNNHHQLKNIRSPLSSFSLPVYNTTSSNQQCTGSLRFRCLGLSCLSTIASAAPFSFPLSNGFPTVANSSSQLTAIEQQAHGTLPNGPPPPSITADTLTSLELIAFNELFEVAYFTELLFNVKTTFRVSRSSTPTSATASSPLSLLCRRKKRRDARLMR